MCKELYQAYKPGEAIAKLKGIFKGNAYMIEKVDGLKRIGANALLALLEGKTITNDGSKAKADYSKHRAATNINVLRDLGIPIQTVTSSEAVPRSLYVISEETIKELIKDPETVTTDYIKKREEEKRERELLKLKRLVAIYDDETENG